MNTDYKIIQQQHHWTSEEKLKFGGYGEWVEEPDSIELEYKGYEAFVIRIWKREPHLTEEAYFGGHLCGYVVIPKSHPYYENKEIDLEVHGEISYNEVHEEHIIGFDCAHVFDLIPTVDKWKKINPELKKLFIPPKGLEKNDWFNPQYRNMAYCIQQCIHMIDQLVKIEDNSLKEK